MDKIVKEKNMARKPNSNFSHLTSELTSQITNRLLVSLVILLLVKPSLDEALHQMASLARTAAFSSHAGQISDPKITLNNRASASSSSSFLVSAMKCPRSCRCEYDLKVNCSYASLNIVP